MKKKQIEHADLANAYKVTSGKGFKLSDFDPSETDDVHDKVAAEQILQDGIEKLAEFQEKLYAQDRWALLLIFQAMDAAGKDSTIKHVMSGVNPQGCEVYSFKAPSNTELDHDFLWRCSTRLPERGRIGIFNRSYYEETLVVRVHPEVLKKEKMPDELVTKNLWKERFEDINCYERYLTRNGVVIRKFFLNVSKKEQKKRFLKRLDDKEKHWKFSAADVKEREFWDDYMKAYQDMIQHTATDHAPWYVIPADHKWFARMVVASAIIETLDCLKLEYPKLEPAQEKELGEARKVLEQED
jgi:PPK2 family polyphosphate:nucleotide phosphotransferase